MRAMNDKDVEKALDDVGLELRPDQLSKGELAQALVSYFFTASRSESVCGASGRKR